MKRAIGLPTADAIDRRACEGIRNGVIGGLVLWALVTFVVIVGMGL